MKYGNWKRDNLTEAWKEYKKSKPVYRGLFPQQRKTNRRNVQHTYTVSQKKRLNFKTV